MERLIFCMYMYMYVLNRALFSHEILVNCGEDLLYSCLAIGVWVAYIIGELCSF